MNSFSYNNSNKTNSAGLTFKAASTPQTTLRTSTALHAAAGNTTSARKTATTFTKTVTMTNSTTANACFATKELKSCSVFSEHLSHLQRMLFLQNTLMNLSKQTLSTNHSPLVHSFLKNFPLNNPPLNNPPLNNPPLNNPPLNNPPLNNSLFHSSLSNFSHLVIEPPCNACLPCHPSIPTTSRDDLLLILLNQNTRFANASASLFPTPPPPQCTNAKEDRCGSHSCSRTS